MNGRELRVDLQAADNHAFVGYHNIYPRFSTARHPNDWFRSRGTRSCSGPAGSVASEHIWFKARKGDMDITQLSDPIGRDVFRGIEEPLIETGGGSIWERVPSGALVVGESLEGLPRRILWSCSGAFAWSTTR